MIFRGRLAQYLSVFQIQAKKFFKPSLKGSDALKLNDARVLEAMKDIGGRPTLRGVIDWMEPRYNRRFFLPILLGNELNLRKKDFVEGYSAQITQKGLDALQRWKAVHPKIDLRGNPSTQSKLQPAT